MGFDAALHQNLNTNGNRGAKAADVALQARRRNGRSQGADRQDQVEDAEMLDLATVVNLARIADAFTEWSRARAAIVPRLLVLPQPHFEKIDYFGFVLPK